MKKSIRNIIVKDLEVLGYNVSHNEAESNRLENVYKLKTPNSINEIKCTINKQVILFNYFIGGIEFGVDVCSYGLLLDNGKRIAHGKENENFANLIVLVVAMRTLLEIETPTIII